MPRGSLKETARIVNNEPYFSAKCLAIIFHALGLEEPVQVYTDLRRVDDHIDSDRFSRDEKLAFISQEWERVKWAYSGEPDPVYSKRFWDLAPANMLFTNLGGIFAAMRQDIILSHCEARSVRQNLTDYKGGFEAPVQLASLFFTQELINVSPTLRSWLWNAYIGGNLRDLAEDIKAGQVKMPLLPSEAILINKLPSREEKEEALKTIYCKKRFDAVKWRSLGKMLKNCGAWVDSGLPYHLVLGILLYQAQAISKVALTKYPWSDRRHLC